MNKYLIKVAKETQKDPKLRPHTERALKKLEERGGLLVDHSMGSGKTLLYLKAIELHQKQNPKDHALVIAPASLTTNIAKEIKKHKVKIDPSRLETLSYEKASLDSERLKQNKYGIVVADEAHKLRNTGTKRHQELSEVITNANKRLLGTGTTAYNHPSDIAPLVNLVAKNKVLPEGRTAFEERYVEKKTEQPPLLKRILGHPAKEVHKLKRKGELEKVLRQHIDHYDLRDDPAAADKFPRKKEVVKEVDMSPEQSALYKYMEGKLPWHLRLKVRMNMPLDKKDVSSLQAFSTGIRQISNSTHSYMPNYHKSTPKITAAADSLHNSMLKDKNFRGLVYSNYLDSGLHDYSKELQRRGISHAVYHGGLNKKQKDEMLELYNSGKIPVLLLSSSGAEGLNTKGTKKIQVLEPHFNKSKIDQVVARGVRYESHEHLPPEEREVEVEHYISSLPKKKWNIGPKQHSIDQYLHHNSKSKSELGEEMKKLVKEACEVDEGLVKEALNALKARALAKQVGVIADHTTQWKYGLRKLRSGNGKPLVGDALEKAKVRMGALSKQDFQKVVSKQKEHPGREIGFTMNKHNKIVHDFKVGTHDTVHNVHNPSKGETTGHTHVIPMAHTHHRVTHASGLSEKLELPFKKRSVKEALRHHGMLSHIANHPDLTSSQKSKAFNKYVRGVVGTVNDKKHVTLGGLHSDGADITSAIVHGRGHPYNRAAKQNIISAEHGVDAVHKSTGVIHNDGTVLATKHRTVMFKHAAEVPKVEHRYERHKYKETQDWSHIKDPVGSLKRDGAAFFIEVQPNGSPRYYSRRESVKGGFPDRTEKVPHLANLNFKGYEGNVFHVELVHTGHDYHDDIKDSHATLSGILNSLPDKAIQTQKEIGPVRAVLLDVLEPKLPTYGQKLEYLNKVRNSVGGKEFLQLPNAKIGKAEIQKLLESTRDGKHEGVIITSLTEPEDKNIRIKVKHTDTFNLRVVDMIEEMSILGQPKNSMGALVLADKSGRVVGKVGTGFTRDMRDWFWKNKAKVLGKMLVQVKALPPTAHMLRTSVYNGEADGDIDEV